MSLVRIDRDGEPRASTEVIARGFKVQHKNVLELLRRHEARFDVFGQVAFQTRLNRQGSATEFAMLNEQQAALLITLMRNTPEVLDFKVLLIQEFFELRNALHRREQNLWNQMQEALAREAQSAVRASFGSHLMLQRRRELPGLKTEIERLNSQLHPRLWLDS
ncbi:Rha family transcriptional regulator [Derxia gummosa]|uniref:Rha family transcriptional regulator n=1 Tax=Derxia gummosa DSM 723 TaxID=1121388 RepID=A0A8B6X3R8_9BURK|nr:Rha family transcriptional regulator [Derxia gummosa]